MKFVIICKNCECANCDICMVRDADTGMEHIRLACPRCGERQDY